MPDADLSVERLLRQKRSVVLKRWFEQVLDSYPEETSRFLRKEANPFANPVGSTIHRELGELLDEILDGPDRGRAGQFLDRIIRIRAIQDFSPADAIAFVFGLKGIAREELGRELEESLALEDWLAFEGKVDQMGLLAFDVYMNCREKLAQIRVDEIRNRNARLLRRAGVLAEGAAAETGPESSDLDGLT